MCGFLTYFDIENNYIPELLQNGLSALTHRGPDNEGIFQDKDIFLGHRRLKIIDLSDSANQPMSCENGRYWIVYNGEIYNFQELRQFLTSKGYLFKTKGDTEVLLKLYQELEKRCLERLNGMYSFVIYDKYKKNIFAARDRIGIKPLFYYWDGRVLSISSEIKAFLEANIINREIDIVALKQYLVYGSVKSPRTIFKSIKSLLPGHYLCLENKSLRIKKYWEIPFIPEADKPTESLHNASNKVRELLEDSIRLQMISDVPLGAFLSGGIDSSVIVALMSKLTNSEVKTFSIGFDVGGSSYNEIDYAKKIATMYSTDHNEIVLSGKDIAQEISPFIRCIDQPSVDGFNSYFISQYAREKVTVSLSGLGGDELFAGYTKAKFYHNLSSIRNRFPYFPNTIYSILKMAHEELPMSIKRNRFLRGSLAALGLWAKPIDFFSQFSTYHTQTELKHLLINQNSNEVVENNEILTLLEKLSPLDAATFFYITFYMQNTLLRDIDMVSMAHSLEVRVPFLDHRLIEYVVQLPIELRMKRGETKYLLTTATRDLLPKEVIYRKKMGFSFPFGIWLMNSPLHELMLDCFSENGLKKRRIFNNKELDRILKNGLKEDSTNRPSFIHYKLWMLTILELWLQETNGQLC
ncbi:asparagine synthase (glutamine-hydrolyzing) [Candidatus Latescibacterota bacterium]